MRDLRRFITRFRDPRAAIDLASIMVGVLLVAIIGGVIAASVFLAVPWTQDAAARSALGAVANAQASSRVVDGSYSVFDSHPDSTHRAFEVGDPGISPPSNRLIIDITDSGSGWLAAQSSPTGAIYFMASTGSLVVEVGDMSQLAIPDGLQATVADDMLHAIEDDIAYDFRADVRPGLPGFGPGVESAPEPPPVVPPGPQMVSTWDTSIPGCDLLQLPVASVVDVVIDWGDGEIDAWKAPPYHFYTDTPGLKTIVIEGTFGSWGSSDYSAECLISVDRWDNTGTHSLWYAFNNATNLVEVAEIPDGVTDMTGMFRGATSFNGPVNFDTSEVTKMFGMFQNATSFNQPVNFDTSKVENMASMFNGATSFNQPVNFSAASPTGLTGMFKNATSFNSPVTLDTSNASSIADMFFGASSFNQPLAFDTSNVTNLQQMFYNATSFNQDLTGWDVGAVIFYGSFANGSALTPGNTPNFS